MRALKTCVLSLCLLTLLPAPAPAQQTTDPAPDTPESLEDAVSELEEMLAAYEAEAEDLPAPPPAPPPSGDTFATTPEAAARAAGLATYADTGEPPILGLPTHRAFPYGHETPVLRCLPLRACDLELEAGEAVHGWALGDTERWLTEELTEGTDAAATPHLLVKPTDFDLATNLVVITDRRTYHLELESPPADEAQDEDGNPRVTGYDLHLAWWYPDDFVERSVRRRAAAASRAAQTEQQHRRATALDRPLAVDPRDLSFAYRLRAPWRPSRRLGWKPTTVFDDGQRVYLRLPPEAAEGELPVLLGILDDGEHQPLNVQLRGDWLIVPTLFERAELVLGTGGRRRSLRIVSSRGED